MSFDIFLDLSFFAVVAALYSSVGHAGASGYLAIMALLSFSPSVIKTNSLILNIIVAFIASVNFIKEGYFDKKVFLLFALTSIPMAYWGGTVQIDPKQFKLVAGIFLIFSAVLLPLRQFISARTVEVMPLNVYAALLLGALIGFVSGVIGVGGGIFLSPILIIFKWANLKNASGVAALFIFFNSAFALLGHFKGAYAFDPHLFYWVIGVVLGGFVGSHLGAKKLSTQAITLCLFVVLMSAGIKFTFIDYFKK